MREQNVDVNDNEHNDIIHKENTTKSYQNKSMWYFYDFINCVRSFFPHNLN